MWQGIFPDRSVLTVPDNGPPTANRGEALLALAEWERGRVPLRVGASERPQTRYMREHLIASGAIEVEGPPDVTTDLGDAQL